MNDPEFKPRRLRLQEFDQLFAIEYSVVQDAFNVRTVSEMLENNRANVLRRTSLDYVPIAFTDSREDADDVVRKLRDNIYEQSVRTETYEAETTKSESDRLQLIEHCDDMLWAKFRMSSES
jgi:hypothetical protein